MAANHHAHRTDQRQRAQQIEGDRLAGGGAGERVGGQQRGHRWSLARPDSACPASLLTSCCRGSNRRRWRLQPWGAAPGSCPPATEPAARFFVDQVGAVVVGHLVVVGHRQRAGRAGFDAQPAADAAQIVDLVHPAIAFARRKPRLVGVVGALDVDGVRRAGPRAQFAADALLQAVLVAVELMAAVIARLPPGPGSPDTPR